MKEIKRDIYLEKLISRKENGLIKIITGIRRCGKSYLLDPLFKNYLLECGVKENHIIKLELDKEENKKYHDIEDSFIVNKSDRYDVKGKKYIQTPQKYYFSDIGLRNARLNFRQQEENHIMENIIYNELIVRGYNVDVNVVEIRDENKSRKQLEVDFVCNLGNKRYYVQSALNLDTREKTIQEERTLMNIRDNFKKIIVVKDNMKHWFTEEGILIIVIQEFLLKSDSLDL